MAPRRLAKPLLLAAALVLMTAPVVLGQEEAGSLGADRDWRFVEQLRADGMQDVAARQLEAFARDHADDPRAPQALLDAATLYRNLDQPLAALGAYEQLLERYPQAEEAPEALLQKGELLAATQRHRDAAEAYRSLLTSYPASEQADAARLGLGEAALALDQSDEAARLFRYLVGGRAAPPLAARALFDLGVLHEKAGRDSLAMENFEAVSRRFPDQVIGAFGLLRSAEILARREAPAAARQRYEQVVKRYGDPFLQARADLGLAALDEGERRWKDAAERYRAVAERGGSPEQVQTALLGLARSEMAADRPEKAQEAARAYLEKYPEGADADRARLVAAQAAVRRGEDGSRDRLRQVADTAAPEVAYQALVSLAEASEDEPARARGLWWEASQKAPAGEDRRATALLRASTLTGQAEDRPALAAEMAEEAARAADSDSLRARALGRALSWYRTAGREERAETVARSLATSLPLEPAAVQARDYLRLLQRRPRPRPQEALDRLARLALQAPDDPLARRIEIARILRETAADPEAAARILEDRDAAGAPEVQARAALERGRSLEAVALTAALADPAGGAWRDPLEAARAAYARAASVAGAEAAAAEARVALLRLDLARAARPDAPPLFDAQADPLLEGVGAQEALDLSAPGWSELADRLRAAVESAPAGSRPWLRWRAAETSLASPLQDRLEWTARALDEGPSAPVEMGLRYTRGQLLLAAEKPGEAAAQLRRVLDAQEAGDVSVAARYAMAEIQRGERRYDAARQLYLDYARAFPRSQRGQRALLLAGDMALYAGDVDEAARTYESILQRYPQGPYADDAGYRLGTAQLRRGRLEAARDRFEPLARQGSGSRYAGRALLKLAEVESRAGHDSLAVAALERLTEVDPEVAAQEGAPLRLARLELERDRPAAALKWIDARRGEPTAESLSLRVEAEARAGRLDDAARSLQRLDEGYPEAGEAATAARCDLADARLEAGKAEEALETYQEARSAAPTAALRARALYGTAMALMRLERFDESKQAFVEASRAAPGSEWSAQALFKVGGIATRQGRDEEAQQAFQELADRYPDHPLAPEALKGLAASWRRLSRFDKALEVYHQLLEEYPDVDGASQILGSIAYCYHELGRYEVSIAAYERAMPLLDEEEQAYGQFWIADSLEKLQRLEEAAAAYLKIPYLYPQSGQLPVTAQLKAAGVYEQLGEKEAAVRLYEKVVRSHGRQSQWGGEAARRLERLQGGGDGGS